MQSESVIAARPRTPVAGTDRGRYAGRSGSVASLADIGVDQKPRSFAEIPTRSRECSKIILITASGIDLDQDAGGPGRAVCYLEAGERGCRRRVP